VVTKKRAEASRLRGVTDVKIMVRDVPDFTFPNLARAGSGRI